MTSRYLSAKDCREIDQALRSIEQTGGVHAYPSGLVSWLEEQYGGVWPLMCWIDASTPDYPRWDLWPGLTQSIADAGRARAWVAAITPDEGLRVLTLLGWWWEQVGDHWMAGVEGDWDGDVIGPVDSAAELWQQVREWPNAVRLEVREP